MCTAEQGVTAALHQLAGFARVRLWSATAAPCNTSCGQRSTERRARLRHAEHARAAAAHLTTSNIASLRMLCSSWRGSSNVRQTCISCLKTTSACGDEHVRP